MKVENIIDDFSLDAKILQPIGIIINELLTNIMKYAFAGRISGLVRISAASKADEVLITIEDDGNGIPESIASGKSTGFGILLVSALAKQLGGSLHIERGGGTRIMLEFTK